MKHIRHPQAIVGAALFGACSLPAIALAQPGYAPPVLPPMPPAASSSSPNTYPPPAGLPPSPGYPLPNAHPESAPGNARVGYPPPNLPPAPAPVPPPTLLPSYAPASPQVAAPPEPEREPSLLVASVGFGIGVPYGVFGGGITLGFDYLAVVAGLGTTVVAGAGYGFGARIYFVDSGHEFRPHLTAVWGTTAVYQKGEYDSSFAVIRGFGFYAGLDHDFGPPGGWYVTYGLGYITYGDKTPASSDTPINAMFALGYRLGGK